MGQHEQIHMAGVFKEQQGAMSYSRINERKRKRRCQRGNGKEDAFIFTLSDIQVSSREVI